MNKQQLNEMEMESKKEVETQKSQGPQAVDLTGTVAKHYNELQEAGLETRKDSRIFFLRNFNNWIKSVVIGETLNRLRDENTSDLKVSVLDLCAGKGGDLLKWRKGRISKLICADIAETSVEQCEVRYNDMVDKNSRDRYPQQIFKAEFIAADCTKKRLKDLYKDPSTEFDLCSCQFSFHYCFESIQQAEMMLRNACECLRLGGYFIGTTPNSYEILHRLRQTTDHSFGNDVYRITYQSDDVENIPLFGAKYNFHLEGVVDCPEFLVNFQALEKLAEEFGMKLLLRKPFAEYFKEKSEHGDHSSLLRKMKALETYPADRDTNLVSEKPEDYKTVEAVVKHLQESDDQADDRHRRPVKVGTLSQAEWEATTIYCVFVFQKVVDKRTGQMFTPKKEETHKRPAGDQIRTDESESKIQKVT
ncbi:RNMT [Mytilus coruscus]|uniref:mRNA cap guanine-N(7) methyltransferase n=1 Tax=Mytilus coruscus TaxID=42192 RepID=A0A6J8E3R9_MYTCO|nr:RNMT [Mytilus coruscus]